MAPDLCLVNWYRAGSRLGLHQDKDEGAASIARGAPVVSISLGETALFQLGGLRRKDPVEIVPLESGDAFVFGGPSRLRYHGVSRITPLTAPPELAIAGRFNLTLRQLILAGMFGQTRSQLSGNPLLPRMYRSDGLLAVLC